MIKEKRQKRILSILHREGVVDVTELSRIMPEVSKVTIRRDIAELAEADALKRTHGGALLPDAKVIQYPRIKELRSPADGEVLVSALDSVDAIILPPIFDLGGKALRRQICKRNIPFLAESAPQSGGVYLGPDNYKAGHELGCLAGADVYRQDAVTVLIIAQPELSNTIERVDGFEKGFHETCKAEITVIRVNGQGSYKSALRVATDAFQANEVISVVFGVNDHSASAGIVAAELSEHPVSVYAVGGESPEFLAQVDKQGPLRAVAAFFPEVVGAIAVDALAAALSGDPLPEIVATPFAILTASNLGEYYEPINQESWTLKEEVFSRLVSQHGQPPDPVDIGGRIGFMPHYPSHDWYRAMIRSLTSRAERYGLELAVSSPHQGIAAEIARLQREIAEVAVMRIRAGETVIIGEGAANICLAEELRRRVFTEDQLPAGITVITNSLDVLYKLEDVPGIKVIMTGGEYQAADRCLVGPSLGALFVQMRADIAFLSVAGVTPKFGVSAVDERRALAGRRFVGAARHTIALADHTLVGADANYYIARIEDVAEIITDDGALPVYRQSLRTAGVEVFVVGLSEDDRSPQKFSQDQRVLREISP